MAFVTLEKGSPLSSWLSLAVTAVPRPPMLLAQMSLRFREAPVAASEEEDESAGGTALMVDEEDTVEVVEGAAKAVLASGMETTDMVEAVEGMLASSVVSRDIWPGIAIRATEEVEMGGMEVAEVIATTLVSKGISPVTAPILAEIGEKLGVNVYLHVTLLFFVLLFNISVNFVNR